MWVKKSESDIETVYIEVKRRSKKELGSARIVSKRGQPDQLVPYKPSKARRRLSNPIFQLSRPAILAGGFVAGFFLEYLTRR